MALAIRPESIVSYFGNIVSPICANYLDINSIKVYHAYAYQTYKVHNKQYTCYCSQCRIFKLLLEVAVGRQKDSSFFLWIEDYAKICFVRTSRYVGDKGYIGFKKCKHVEKSDLDAFKCISRRMNIDSYFLLSILGIESKKSNLLLIF